MDKSTTKLDEGYFHDFGEIPARHPAFERAGGIEERGEVGDSVYTKHIHPRSPVDDRRSDDGMTELKGVRVLLGVSGGVSAFKAVELLRLLTKEGAIVDVVMTPSATRFVGVETFRALSGRPVLTELFYPAGSPGEAAVMPHLDPAEAAELAIIAPATANTLAKMACGIADNALLTTLLSVTAPVLVAPAMDSDMWRHPATQANIELLKRRGVRFVGPVTGELARRNVGPGRLAEPREIMEAAVGILKGGGLPRAWPGVESSSLRQGRGSPSTPSASLGIGRPERWGLLLQKKPSRPAPRWY